MAATDSSRPMMTEMKQCGFCAAPFTPRTAHHRFCTPACRKSAFTDGERRGVHRLTSAAISQTLVTMDLMRRGYAVYRAQSSAYAADLVAIVSDEDTTLRVKVKTLRRRADGSISVPQLPAGVDILALVVDRQVSYREEKSGSLLETLEVHS